MATEYPAQTIAQNNYEPKPQMQLSKSTFASPEDLAKMEYTILPMVGEWRNALGQPAKQFKLMIHGEPGNGKTVLTLRLAKYLAENFGPTLYISAEEFGSPTLSKKIKDFEIYSHNLRFGRDLKTATNIDEFEFVIIDSINRAGLDIKGFTELLEKHPNKSFIIILQHNKDGSFKGGKEWEHEVDIAGKVVNRQLEVYKNRYADTINV